jgi:hypothetical protein
MMNIILVIVLAIIAITFSYNAAGLILVGVVVDRWIRNLV